MAASATSWKHDPFKEGILLPYQATFDRVQLARLKMGLIPGAMEDKWFVYFEEPHLFLHRSWTGQPVFRLTLKNLLDGAEVTETLWSEAGTSDSAYQVRLLDFLVSNLLLGQSKPFPVPPGVTEPIPGIFQHHVSGTAYPQLPTQTEHAKSAEKKTNRP